jgi:hypothetical protein
MLVKIRPGSARLPVDLEGLDLGIRDSVRRRWGSGDTPEDGMEFLMGIPNPRTEVRMSEAGIVRRDRPPGRTTRVDKPLELRLTRPTAAMIADGRDMLYEAEAESTNELLASAPGPTSTTSCRRLARADRRPRCRIRQPAAGR